MGNYGYCVARAPEKEQTKTLKAKGRASSEDDATLTSAMTKLSVAADSEPSSSKPGSTTKADLPAVVKKPAELYLWDQDDGHFLKQADIHGSIVKESESSFDYLVVAATLEGQQLFAHKLTSDLNARWSTKLASCTWNHTSAGGTLSSWCFKLETLDDFREFQEAWGSCLYESLNQASWAKAKVRVHVV